MSMILPHKSNHFAVAGAIVDALEQQSRNVIRHNADWYVYNGCYYERADGDEAIRTVLWDVLSAAKYVDPKTNNAVPFVPQKPYVTSILDAFTAQLRLRVKGSPRPNAWLNGRTEKVHPCRNGLVLVGDWDMLPFTPDYFNTFVTSYDYVPGFKHARLQRFWREVLPGDDDAIRFVHECQGDVLFNDDNTAQTVPIFLGPTGCGKGTIDTITDRLLGPGQHGGLNLEDYKRNSFPKEPFVGKRYVTFSDNRGDLKVYKQEFLQLLLQVAGQDVLSIRTPWARRSETGTIDARLWILTNEEPELEDASMALIRRLKVVKFARKFADEGTEDTGLRAELTRPDALSAAFNHAIAGWKRLNQRGGKFVQPRCGRAVLERIRANSNPVAPFIAECCKLDPDGKVRKADLLHVFGGWALENGLEAKYVEMKLSQFSKFVRGVSPKIEARRLMEDGTRDQWFLGVRLLVGP